MTNVRTAFVFVYILFSLVLLVAESSAQLYIGHNNTPFVNGVNTFLFENNGDNLKVQASVEFVNGTPNPQQIRVRI